MVNVKVSDFFKMKGALFVIDSYKDVMDVIGHYSHLIKLFFYGGGWEFIVVIQLYNASIKAIQTSI